MSSVAGPVAAVTAVSSPPPRTASSSTERTGVRRVAVTGGAGGAGGKGAVVSKNLAYDRLKTEALDAKMQEMQDGGSGGRGGSGGSVGSGAAAAALKAGEAGVDEDGDEWITVHAQRIATSKRTWASPKSVQKNKGSVGDINVSQPELNQDRDQEPTTAPSSQQAAKKKNLKKVTFSPDTVSNHGRSTNRMSVAVRPPRSSSTLATTPVLEQTPPGVHRPHSVVVERNQSANVRSFNNMYDYHVNLIAPDSADTSQPIASVPTTTKSDQRHPKPKDTLNAARSKAASSTMKRVLEDLPAPAAAITSSPTNPPSPTARTPTDPVSATATTLAQPTSSSSHTKPPTAAEILARATNTRRKKPAVTHFDPVTALAMDALERLIAEEAEWEELPGETDSAAGSSGTARTRGMRSPSRATSQTGSGLRRRGAGGGAMGVGMGSRPPVVLFPSLLRGPGVTPVSGPYGNQQQPHQQYHGLKERILEKWGANRGRVRQFMDGIVGAGAGGVGGVAKKGSGDRERENKAQDDILSAYSSAEVVPMVVSGSSPPRAAAIANGPPPGPTFARPPRSQASTLIPKSQQTQQQSSATVQPPTELIPAPIQQVQLLTQQKVVQYLASPAPHQRSVPQQQNMQQQQPHQLQQQLLPQEMQPQHVSAQQQNQLPNLPNRPAPRRPSNSHARAQVAIPHVVVPGENPPELPPRPSTTQVAHASSMMHNNPRTGSLPRSSSKVLSPHKAVAPVATSTPPTMPRSVQSSPTRAAAAQTPLSPQSILPIAPITQPVPAVSSDTPVRAPSAVPVANAVGFVRAPASTPTQATTAHAQIPPLPAPSVTAPITTPQHASLARPPRLASVVTPYIKPQQAAAVPATPVTPVAVVALSAKDPVAQLSSGLAPPQTPVKAATDIPGTPSPPPSTEPAPAPAAASGFFLWRSTRKGSTTATPATTASITANEDTSRVVADSPEDPTRTPTSVPAAPTDPLPPPPPVVEKDVQASSPLPSLPMELDVAADREGSPRTSEEEGVATARKEAQAGRGIIGWLFGGKPGQPPPAAAPVAEAEGCEVKEVVAGTGDKKTEVQKSVVVPPSIPTRGESKGLLLEEA